MINSNNGMFLETLINISGNYYISKEILGIYKREVPIKIISKHENNYIKGKIMYKSTTDYYGVYKSHMFDFEAKQTNHDDFLMQNLKEHQYNHLQNIQVFGVHAFLLIHFVKWNTYFAIEPNQLVQFQHKTKIPYEWIKLNCKEMHVVFPGILDFEEYLDQVYKARVN